MLRPLREETSTIKLWLACLANHLEFAESHEEHTSFPNMLELFGPCSPVHHLLTSSTLASLVEACTATASLVLKDTSVISADSIGDEMTIEKAVAVPSRTLLLQTVTPIEDVVVVEDASDDEEAVSQVIIEDPIDLITIEDNPLHSMTEVKEEAITFGDNPLHSTTEVNEEVPNCIEDPSIIAAPSSMAIAMEENDLMYINTCKSYDRSSLCRSGRIAKHNVLKDLGVVGKDGKINEDAMQDIVVGLKELLPPDLLKSLMSLKGHAFWDFVAEAFLPLR
ncbi:hypothetical protein SORBI_3008G029700 [Sorghum bicolor]|uniref:Uncharacterized protein n=1 Tax=Sorghum bicolor TaxID=4558 RepID=A0A1B6PB26_SORBI|nr:hypothetical protein SORBI_3008G029700 [Sorghum bicolor]